MAFAMKVARHAVAVVLAILSVATVVIIFVIPRLTGGAALTVLSGSMTPTYSVGSVVVVRPVEAAEVREGDVITYAEPSGTFTTHRVIDVDPDSHGDPSFTTKGDANRGEDTEPVTADGLRGKVWFHVPYLGHVRSTLASPEGLASIIALAALALSWDRLRPHARRFTRLRRSVGVGISAIDRHSIETVHQQLEKNAMPNPSMGIPTVAPLTSTAGTDNFPAQQLLVAQMDIGWLERREVMDLLPLVRGHVVAISLGSLTIAVVGVPSHLDAVEELLEHYSLNQVGRSSIVTPVARPHPDPTLATPKVH